MQTLSGAPAHPSTLQAGATGPMPQSLGAALCRSAPEDDLHAFFNEAEAASTGAPAWAAAVAASEQANVHCQRCGLGVPALRVPRAVHAALLQAATADDVVYTMHALAEAVNPWPAAAALAFAGDERAASALGAMHACILAVRFSRSSARFETTAIDMHVVKHGEHDFEVAATVAPHVWPAGAGAGATQTPCPQARALGGRFASHAVFVRHALGARGRRARLIYVNTAKLGVAAAPVSAAATPHVVPS